MIAARGWRHNPRAARGEISIVVTYSLQALVVDSDFQRVSRANSIVSEGPRLGEEHVEAGTAIHHIDRSVFGHRCPGDVGQQEYVPVLPTGVVWVRLVLQVGDAIGVTVRRQPFGLDGE